MGFNKKNVNGGTAFPEKKEAERRKKKESER